MARTVGREEGEGGQGSNQGGTARRRDSRHPEETAEEGESPQTRTPVQGEVGEEEEEEAVVVVAEPDLEVNLASSLAGATVATAGAVATMFQDGKILLVRHPDVSLGCLGGTWSCLSSSSYFLACSSVDDLVIEAINISVDLGLIIRQARIFRHSASRNVPRSNFFFSNLPSFFLSSSIWNLRLSTRR